MPTRFGLVQKLLGAAALALALSLSSCNVSSIDRVTASPSLVPTRAQPSPTLTLVPSLQPTSTPTTEPTPTLGPSPQLIASYPIQGDEAVVSSLPLRLVFDQPINLDGIQLTIQPELDGSIEIANTNTLVFTPLSGWPETSISCTVSGVSGTSGTLPATIELSFSSGGYGVPVPALMYHHLEEAAADAPQWIKDWTVSPSAFAEQMAFLNSEHYNSISPDELAAYFEGQPLPPKPIIITIDDGYRDVYTTAWPILKNTDLRPVLFISPEYIECGAYLTHQQIEELLDGGCYSGVHGYDHSSLTEQTGTRLSHQIVDARDVLEDISKQAIHTFCYPYGAYNNSTIDALKENGYKTAFTLNNWLYQPYDEPFKLNRLRIDYDTTFADFVEMLTLQ